jgi:hypothetical protein
MEAYTPTREHAIVMRPKKQATLEYVPPDSQAWYVVKVESPWTKIMMETAK